MTTYESLLANVMQLSVNDRLQLVEAIWETIPEESLPPLSPEWQAEIERRSAEVDAGTVRLLNWDEVKENVLRRIENQ